MNADEHAILTVLLADGKLDCFSTFQAIDPRPPRGRNRGSRRGAYRKWLNRRDCLWDAMNALWELRLIEEATTTVHDAENFGKYQITEAGRAVLTAAGVGS